MPVRSRLGFALLMIVILAMRATGHRDAAAVDRAETDADRPVFEKDIQPIFQARCGECHNAKARKGSLDLSSMAAVLRVVTQCLTPS